MQIGAYTYYCGWELRWTTSGGCRGRDRHHVFYGGKRGDRTYAPKPMGPKTMDELKALVGSTKLPFIVKVIGNRIPILVDSGIRRGADVMKALALGADAVLAGWAMAMGLAADGSQGVSEMLNTLTAELQRIMSVTGCKQLADIDKKVLVERDYLIRR